MTAVVHFDLARTFAFCLFYLFSTFYLPFLLCLLYYLFICLFIYSLYLFTLFIIINMRLETRIDRSEKRGTVLLCGAEFFAEVTLSSKQLHCAISVCVSNTLI